MIWIAALLATLISIDSLFRQDYDDGSLELAVLSPHPLASILLGKVLAHWLVTGLPLILVAPVLCVMLHLDGATIAIALLSLLLGTPVLTLISAIGAALTVGLGKGGVLVAVIALPLYIPVLIFGTGAVQAAAMELPYSAQIAYLGALLLVSLALIPFALAAGIKVSINH